ncbi:MAG TPA: tetratricopeptide repeat protein, partial [Hellea balneolensis]|nr:tetratricopeptide repeat protein [Hellea balneolensis]
MVEMQPRIRKSDLLIDIDRAMKQRDLARANSLAIKLTEAEPKNIDGWMARARIAQMAGDYQNMQKWTKAALNLSPKHPLALLMNTESLVHLGEINKASRALEVMQKNARNDANWLTRIAEIYTQCGLFENAVKCLERARRLQPENPEIRYHYATSLIAIGDLLQAEEQFDELIKQAPHDYDAYYNRSNLRKQTWSDNHIDAIKNRLSQTVKHPMGVVQLNYALAKELEDIGEYEDS